MLLRKGFDQWLQRSNGVLYRVEPVAGIFALLPRASFNLRSHFSTATVRTSQFVLSPLLQDMKIEDLSMIATGRIGPSFLVIDALVKRKLVLLEVVNESIDRNRLQTRFRLLFVDRDA